jgi:hypothetical protein
MKKHILVCERCDSPCEAFIKLKIDYDPGGGVSCDYESEISGHLF